MAKSADAPITFEADDDPIMVDAFLRESYGHGIYSFTHCLANILNEEYLFRPLSRSKTNYQTLYVRLREFFIRMIKTLYALNEFTTLGAAEYKEPEKIGGYHYHEIIKRYKLGYCSRVFFSQLAIIRNAPEFLPSPKKRGRDVRARNIIALVWSKIMKKPQSNKVDWENMSTLFEWFAWTLRKTSFGKLLSLELKKTDAKGKTDDIDEFNLRREVHRLKSLQKQDKIFADYVKKSIKTFFPEIEPSNNSLIDFIAISKPSSIYLDIGGPDFFDVKTDKLIIFPDGKSFPRSPTAPDNRSPRRP